MSFAGYGIILFDVSKEPIDFDEIPEIFTTEYFVIQLKENWTEAKVHYGDTSLGWTIPELDFGDPERPGFNGNLTYEDKGIHFGLTPYSTIATFVLWMRSIIPLENSVYLLKISEFHTLQIEMTTREYDVIRFLENGISTE